MLTQAREPFKTFLYIVQLARARARERSINNARPSLRVTEPSGDLNDQLILLSLLLFCAKSLRTYTYLHYESGDRRVYVRTRSLLACRAYTTVAVRLLLRRRRSRPLREVAKNNRRRPFRAADYILATYIYIPSAIIVYR